jgi:putative transcriptional regulator
MNRLKIVLQDRGIKQSWLASQLGKSCSVINEYCLNKRQPKLDVLFQIADILDVNLILLIDDKFIYSKLKK